MNSPVLSPFLIRGYATQFLPKPAMRHPDPLLNKPNNADSTLLAEDLTFIHRPLLSSPSPLSYMVNASTPLLRAEPPTPSTGVSVVHVGTPALT